MIPPDHVLCYTVVGTTRAWKVFFGCFLDRIKRPKVMSMVKSGPTALNFVYDFVLTVHLFGTPWIRRILNNLVNVYRILEIRKIYLVFSKIWKIYIVFPKIWGNSQSFMRTYTIGLHFKFLER